MKQIITGPSCLNTYFVYLILATNWVLSWCWAQGGSNGTLRPLYLHYWIGEFLFWLAGRATDQSCLTAPDTNVRGTNSLKIITARSGPSGGPVTELRDKLDLRMSAQREQRDQAPAQSWRENEECIEEVLSNFQPVFVDVGECADTRAGLTSLRYHSHLSGTRASLDPSFVFTLCKPEEGNKRLNEL